jgi:hypothetical protein
MREISLLTQRLSVSQEGFTELIHGEALVLKQALGWCYRLLYAVRPRLLTEIKLAGASGRGSHPLPLSHLISLVSRCLAHHSCLSPPIYLSFLQPL